MPFVTWSDALSIHVETIDDQHRDLVDKLNHLYTALIQCSGDAEVKAALAVLIDHTVTHFSFEEGLMDDLAYPGCDIHKLEHAVLIARIREVEVDLARQHAAIDADAMVFLRDWLLSHIEMHDMLLGAFINGETAYR